MSYGIFLVLLWFLRSYSMSGFHSDPFLKPKTLSEPLCAGLKWWAVHTVAPALWQTQAGVQLAPCVAHMLLVTPALFSAGDEQLGHFWAMINVLEDDVAGARPHNIHPDLKELLLKCTWPKCPRLPGYNYSAKCHHRGNWQLQRKGGAQPVWVCWVRRQRRWRCPGIGEEQMAEWKG